MGDHAIPDFKLEHFFARWEFVARYMLGSSDVETLSLAELLALGAGESLEWWAGLRLGYTEVQGHPRLRGAIASLYETVPPESIVVFAGAQEAIFAFMNVVLGRGDHAAVVWPCYQGLYEVARSAGAEVDLVPLRHEEGWRLPVERLAEQMTSRTRAIVMNYPHSPTGAQIDGGTFRSIVQLAETRGAYLFCDEVYRLSEQRDEDRLPAAADVCERGVSLGVMSKAFGLAGLRIGWVATHDRALIARLLSFKHYLTICNSAPAEVLATIALQSRTALLARSRTLLAENLRLLEGFFARWPGAFEWVRPRAGTTAFPRLLAPVPIDAFVEDLARTESVLLVPGTVFEYPGNHFRLGFGRRDMPDALQRLERFAERRLAAGAPRMPQAGG